MVIDSAQSDAARRPFTSRAAAEHRAAARRAGDDQLQIGRQPWQRTLPGVEQAGQVLARLQRAQRQEIRPLAKSERCAHAFDRIGPDRYEARIHAQRNHFDPLGIDAQRGDDAIAGKSRNRNQPFGALQQARQHPAIPAGEARSQPLGMFQRHHVMHRDHLRCICDRTGVNR